MKAPAKTFAMTLAFCFLAAVVCFASNDAQMGTWKLNEAKSKLAAGMGKNTTVVYEAAGDNIKVTVDGTDPEGKAMHTEWTGKFDGKDYPVTGDPRSDTRAYTTINDHTLSFTAKKDGKPTITGRATVSSDGKTRTVKVTATDAQGKKSKGTAVYDKQ